MIFCKPCSSTWAEICAPRFGRPLLCCSGSAHASWMFPAVVLIYFTHTDCVLVRILAPKCRRWITPGSVHELTIETNPRVGRSRPEPPNREKSEQRPTLFPSRGFCSRHLNATGQGADVATRPLRTNERTSKWPRNFKHPERRNAASTCTNLAVLGVLFLNEGEWEPLVPADKKTPTRRDNAQVHPFVLR